MNRQRKIPIYFVLCLLLCSLPGISATAYILPSGEYVSTHTTVSGKGSFNETVFIQISKQTDGNVETNQWISSYSESNISRQGWSSQLSIGTVDGALGWNFQRIGLPVTWTHRTGLPSTPYFPKPVFPLIGKKLPQL
jgi:hypothetical protein